MSAVHFAQLTSQRLEATGTRKRPEAGEGQANQRSGFMSNFGSAQMDAGMTDGLRTIAMKGAVKEKRGEPCDEHRFRRVATRRDNALQRITALSDVLRNFITRVHRSRAPQESDSGRKFGRCRVGRALCAVRSGTRTAWKGMSPRWQESFHVMFGPVDIPPPTRLGPPDARHGRQPVSSCG